MVDTTDRGTPCASPGRTLSLTWTDTIRPGRVGVTGGGRGCVGAPGATRGTTWEYRGTVGRVSHRDGNRGEVWTQGPSRCRERICLPTRSFVRVCDLCGRKTQVH